jgi:hypothetical protein
MRTLCLLVTAVSALFCSGCVNAHLRRNTTQQAQVISDVYQQQVLNNLARFVYDPNSLPYFSYATQASSQVQNTAQGNFNSALSGSPLRFTNLGFGLQGTHLANETFQLAPVNDPRKLELMRCAYQKAVATCGSGEMSTSCPDCKTLFNRFYTGDKDGNIASKPHVTTECLGQACWFQFGCKKCIPKSCDCIPIGEYCGVYVWVTDSYGRDELTKLTLTILDFAMNSAPNQITKQVVYHIDQNGLPTTADQAVGMVSASVGIDERPESLIHQDAQVAKGLEQSLISQVEAIDKAITRVRALPEAEKREEIRQELRVLLSQRQTVIGKLEFLRRQLDAGALKNQYVPRESSVAPFPLLQLQQQLQSITPQVPPMMLP